ncbi:MAG: hypothetical protein C4323_11455 [Mastigocladus sp. ERB_26_2]
MSVCFENSDQGSGIGEGGAHGGELTGPHSLGGVGIRGEGAEVFIPWLWAIVPGGVSIARVKFFII